MKVQIMAADVQRDSIEVLPGDIIDLGPDEVAVCATRPTRAEELLYKFIIVGADTIAYMGQHARGRAYVDDLQKIFDGAALHIIARQKQGVDFTHLNPRKAFTAEGAEEKPLGYCILCGTPWGQPHTEDCQRSKAGQ
jgi:hypothetical protein